MTVQMKSRFDLLEENECEQIRNRYASVVGVIKDGLSIKEASEKYSVSRTALKCVIDRVCRDSNPVLFEELRVSCGIGLSVLRKHSDEFIFADGS